MCLPQPVRRRERPWWVESGSGRRTQLRSISLRACWAKSRSARSAERSRLAAPAAAALRCRVARERRRARSSTSAVPAVPPSTSAAAGRTQLRGSRIADSSHASNSSAAISVIACSALSTRSTRSAGGSTGASASRSSSSKLGRASFICSLLGGLFAHELLELLDGSVDEHLGGAVGAVQRAGDLAVVHAEREAHDERLAPVVGQSSHAIEDTRELVSPLHQLLGGVRRG